MRTITLELVRHGPAHNQLLSPLTQYLALCENHPAVTLQLPLEHGQMLYRLGALAYRMGKDPREFQVQDTARLLGDLLAMIPGLTADMNRREHGAAKPDDDNTTHLRLVLSASELALLPFELALAPIGFPGAGQPLLLQSLGPVSITRETRRVAEDEVVWPDRTRVLFVTASPNGLPPPPAEAHLLALRDKLAPWVRARRRGADAADTDARRPDNDIAQHLTVLTNASLEAIQQACAQAQAEPEGGYTHVHILAHGGEYTEGYNTRFGLVLHDPANPSGPADYVSGERLVTALRTSRKGSAGQFARPAVVTLASCHSGAIASVTGVGASIAHALHADGIPMVIASQFPLSFGGSVRMVEILYEGLFSGQDPRRLMIDLRRALYTQFPDTHDWASVTAYSSLPPSFDRQLAKVQINRAQASIDVALKLADEVVAGVERNQRSRGSQGNQKPPKKTRAEAKNGRLPDNDGEMKTAMRRVREAQARLARLSEQLPSQRARIVALLASSDKREAALEYEMLKDRDDEVSKEQKDRCVWPPLARARSRYDEAFSLDPAGHWAVVQFLSLTVLMRQCGQPEVGKDLEGRDPQKLWMLAEVQSQRDRLSGDATKRAWALGNLVELYLMQPLVWNEDPAADTGWSRRAIDAARELAAMTGEAAFEIFSTRRQIVRYLDLYMDLCPLLETLEGTAKTIVDVLPARQFN